MKKTRHKNKNLNPFVISIAVLLSIYTLSYILMLGWGFMTSLKSINDFSDPNRNVLGLPVFAVSKNEILLGNYIKVFKELKLNITNSYYTVFSSTPIRHTASNIGIFDMLLNTLLYAGVGACLMAFVPATVGYMCAKYDYRFSRIVYSAALVIMIIPIVGATPSELSLMRALGLYDTFWGNWIQKFNFTGMYFFVFYAFFKSIPDTYREAAEIDGASQLVVMVKIMFPLAIKMISTVILIQFVFCWNDFQTINLYLPTHPTLAYGIWWMQSLGPKELRNNTPIRITTCMMLALPILIIFVVLKDKLMGNVSMGGLKE